LSQRYLYGIIGHIPERRGIMKQFTVEFDEMTCKWLVHIAELTGKSIESVIVDGIHNQLVAFEDGICKSFTYSE